MVLSTPRVMHILANSVPDLNGYAIRSHDLLVSLKDADICEPVVLTSPSARPFVRSIIERFRPTTAIMSQNELHPKAKIKTLGQI